MPNWCENRVCFKHSDPTKLAELDVALREGKALQYLHPMPSELEGTTAPSDTPNWYDWCVNNWGTKWDVDAEVLHQEDCFVQYRFDSAWSPPISFLEKVCKDFPSLSFELEYYEPGMGYAGKAYFDNGEFSGEDEVDVGDYESEWEDEE